MDVSMNAAALLGGSDVLHSAFDSEPDAAGAEAERRVLRALEAAPLANCLAAAVL
jgi:hypothetical protein